jgi:hypothetical protein
MNLSRIRPSTVALAVSAGVMALVGTDAGNASFLWAGIIVGVVAAIMGLETSGSESFSPGRRVRAMATQSARTLETVPRVSSVGR